MITNAHVVRERSPEVILRDGTRLTSHIIAYDEALDLAAVSVEARDLPSFKAGESKNIQAGEVVLSIGHPWGVSGAVTAGVVIGLEASPSDGRELIAVDLHLRPGYSGGPLLNVDGELVGVNTMMNGPDVGMAIPVHVVKRFLSDNLTA